MSFSPFAIPIVLFISIATVLILRGPLGKALADRVAGRTGTAGAPPDEHLAQELDDLRRRLAELEERVDFSERLLTRNREAERLGPGGRGAGHA